MKIGIVNCGGTISCIETQDGRLLEPMAAQQFASACETWLNPVFTNAYPNLHLEYLTELAFPGSSSGTLDSTNVQPTDWCVLAEFLLERYAEFDGWVVLHGTDTMDFTGSALPFLLSSFDLDGSALAQLSKPVVLTGSQLPLFASNGADHLALNFNTDAYQNICGAVAAAQSGIAEVCVFFENKLHRGSRVVKTDANEFDAFSSPNYPVLAEYGTEFIVYPERLQPGPGSPEVSLDHPDARERVQALVRGVAARVDRFPVMRFSAFPAQHGHARQEGEAAFVAGLLASCAQHGVRGLVLESYGEGNFPSGHPDEPERGAVYRAIAKLIESGVTVMDCTQVLAGRIRRSRYSAGSWVTEVGALPTGDMTRIASFAKLTIMLAVADLEGWSHAELCRLLQLNLTGENADTSRLDCRVNPALLPRQALVALDGSARLINDPHRGPMLVDSNDTVLWRAVTEEQRFANAWPATLVMQNNGELVLYGRDSQKLWNCVGPGSRHGASMLSLNGSVSAGDLQLVVYDYAVKKNVVTLYEVEPTAS